MNETLSMVEALIGERADDVADRYFAGDYGAPDRWSYDAMVWAERHGPARHKLAALAGQGVPVPDMDALIAAFADAVANGFADRMEDLFA